MEKQVNHKNETKLYGREELKEFFKNGRIPTEDHYASLLNSVLVQRDDGFSKDEEYGLAVSPVGASKRLITFYRETNLLEPFFKIEKDMTDLPGLRMAPFEKAESSGSGQSKTPEGEKTPHSDGEKAFYFHENGNIGVGKRGNPRYKIEANGFIASKGRIGTYAEGNVAANGKWQDVVKNLYNCQAFEIVARTGKIKKKGWFSILHATAVCAFGRSSGKIRKTRDYTGFFWNRLNVRWKKRKTADGGFTLQIRSGRNYGDGTKIYYHITQLWKDEMILPSDYFYPTGK